ncbi:MULTISPECIES: hypothetical protein [unclassified Sulfitobacter]|uniref:hypothetical protein n=1 Tax=unclassified Sulfitobacter TaxID=196795 RepID=UPI0023E293A9|nr:MULTISPECIES: hypothetical protein [unclassified Sulfitobacter]MDF3382576.1 hypothetical protein [Sulfitobacter sp. Ks11]MDF3385995.1 hypothetical protein [Sulfitobacter sp. M85]MDF3389414.1 hypothetical protein [Sulfitobacter sp. Ks16]MDF3400051.1 hypothetical protein [Sulfitobacter sp. KE39]MDF3403472.1 hypothetical protein [Sulfitobacter sp. Ks35]
MNATQQLDLIDQTLAGPYGALPLTDYLRRNGNRWVGSAQPPEMKEGLQKQCFRNAWQLRLSHGFPYCEGYGWDIKLGALPFSHAWNLCPKTGRVIDATWNIGSRAIYLGIQLSPKQLMNIIDLTERFGVLQNGREEDLKLVEHVLASRPITAE